MTDAVCYESEDGIMKETTLTCIVCPKGCLLSVSVGDDGAVSSVVGNTCKRGVLYAESELVHPMRTVTSTVRTDGGRIVAVKTASPVPKEMIADVMARIGETLASDCVNIGDVVISDVCGCGVDVICTSPLRR